MTVSSRSRRAVPRSNATSSTTKFHLFLFKTSPMLALSLYRVQGYVFKLFGIPARSTSLFPLALSLSRPPRSSLSSVMSQSSTQTHSKKGRLKNRGRLSRVARNSRRVAGIRDSCAPADKTVLTRVGPQLANNQPSATSGEIIVNSIIFTNRRAISQPPTPPPLPALSLFFSRRLRFADIELRDLLAHGNRLRNFRVPLGLSYEFRRAHSLPACTSSPPLSLLLHRRSSRGRGVSLCFPTLLPLFPFCFPVPPHRPHSQHVETAPLSRG